MFACLLVCLFAGFPNVPDSCAMQLVALICFLLLLFTVSIYHSFRLCCCGCGCFPPSVSVTSAPPGMYRRGVPPPSSCFLTKKQTHTHTRMHARTHARKDVHLVPQHLLPSLFLSLHSFPPIALNHKFILQDAHTLAGSRTGVGWFVARELRFWFQDCCCCGCCCCLLSSK